MAERETDLENRGGESFNRQDFDPKNFLNKNSNIGTVVRVGVGAVIAFEAGTSALDTRDVYAEEGDTNNTQIVNNLEIETIQAGRVEYDLVDWNQETLDSPEQQEQHLLRLASVQITLSNNGDLSNEDTFQNDFSNNADAVQLYVDVWEATGRDPNVDIVALVSKTSQDGVYNISFIGGQLREIDDGQQVLTGDIVFFREAEGNSKIPGSIDADREGQDNVIVAVNEDGSFSPLYSFENVADWHGITDEYVLTEVDDEGIVLPMAYKMKPRITEEEVGGDQVAQQPQGTPVPFTLMGYETENEALSSTEIVLLAAQFSESVEIVNEDGTYSVEFSNAVLAEAGVSRVFLPVETANKAKKQMIDDAYGMALLTPGETIKLRGWRTGNTEKTIKGEIESISTYVVTPEEFDQIKDGLTEKETEFTVSYWDSSPRILMFFEGTKLTIVSKGLKLNDYELMVIMREGFAVPNAYIQDAAAVGQGRITGVSITADPMYIDVLGVRTNDGVTPIYDDVKLEIQTSEEPISAIPSTSNDFSKPKTFRGKPIKDLQGNQL